MNVFNGIFEQGKKSDGRVRELDKTLISDPRDPVLPFHLIQKYGLRPGMRIEVSLGKPFGGAQADQNNGGRQGRNQRNNRHNKRHPKKLAIAPNARVAKDILSIEGLEPEAFFNSLEGRKFENLTSVDPHPRITLEYPGCPPSCRLIDMFCPIGFGQRAMIVSPPKAGKTTLLQQIAFAIEKNHDNAEVIALLIDERPEEVTDFRRNVPCTVLASSNDHSTEQHVALATTAIDRARRKVEQGKDVVILLDSLTRVGRAFNNAPSVANSGRTLSGGMDSMAMAIPKQIFGAARKFEEGGSLTIIATALVDTGSRGDQVIFEEFKGTGNMELILDRSITEKRVFPAINLAASGTRKEHLLMPEVELETINALRRRLLNMPPVQQIEQLLKALEHFRTNAELVGMNKQAAGA
ncbi:MAG: transcription termination factor Rho [Phycisphaeraceae bacterium]|nr:transcription termination factor Rho [Phycisphaeraceae bacterium]